VFPTTSQKGQRRDHLSTKTKCSQNILFRYNLPMRNEKKKTN
jgi:hypothetical protein